MRDYEFGQRLADLRKAKGYSQYQLGTLVGVTDKAVSKWETGAAKPRISMIMKLAAILGVNMEEILSEAHEDAGKDTEALSGKKAELWKKAENRMRSLYGDTPDLVIRNRFLMEKNALGNSDVIVLFETMGLIHEQANLQYAIFMPRALAGCSFVAWLLGATSINPLPAHYYCPECRRVVYQPDSKCGWDLPEKTCDKCGAGLNADGHDLPFEICACGTSDPLVSIDCNLSGPMIDRGWTIALKHLSPYYSFLRQELNKEGGEFRATRIYLCPKKGDAADGIDGIPEIDEKDYLDFLGNVPSVSLIPNKGRREHSNMFPRNLVTPGLMTSAMKRHLNAQREGWAAMPDGAGGPETLTKRFPELKGEVKSFTEFVDILNAVHGTYTVSGPEELAESLGIGDYRLLPLSREDIWHLVCRSSGMGNQMAGIASEIVYKARKGLYHKTLSEDDRNLFEQLHLPPWFADYVQRVIYLFPRSHNVSYGYQLLLTER